MNLRQYLFAVASALVIAGLFYAVWRQGQAAASGYLFNTDSPGQEAGYCLAVAERVRELTYGQGDARLEQHLNESIDYWRSRVGGEGATPGRARLARDSGAPNVNEGALLHLAIQDCANRAVALYGHHFASMEDL